MSTSELAWFKSSYSSGGSGDCVEIALTPSTVHVRDSKDRQGPRMAVSPAVWGDFLGHLTK
ncbi:MULTISPECIES: DUF397 domain-containing protein [Streptomyces]|uniref:DUF397 domain-containing protein n=1 Tax=Streptomyces cadmiisoli TaxID=2184053 RepID=A0A2Z4J4T5_9ACTN|nr:MULTISPECIES: DUF397 domain-containing protein [Streptomyces]AWW39748.1 DUF397 domain-containing protein [Streptomyces cadmiisoli]KOV68654.1 hypothetical protein ADL00_13165 [Streptomyces sp. AS58]